MDPQHLLTLLEKYNAGQCTQEELALLDSWYESLGRERPDHIIAPDSEAAALLTHQQLQALRAQLQSATHQIPVRSTRSGLLQKAIRTAAVLTGMALLCGAVYYGLQWRDRKKVHPAAVQTLAGLDYSRYITLPDGSKVVLHAGSHLEYPRTFSGNVREVTLSGEAYFDIRQNSSSRFVINTGRVKTTVLGTAFNIKAYPGSNEIVVSVTKGKVKVEDGPNMLAVLNPDQQIVYNTEAATLAQRQVHALEEISWTRNDMVFESVPFETIAATISKRYHVNIHFNNEALKQCLVRASFSGTESLEEVLNVLCTVRNATYTIEDEARVIIDGKGCSTAEP
ncbi:FecR family protein [uncultured Chitinophaga sp.]|uniref:FecR family protein n=1 Tax=uncultured Chitinophaga sp. TaxID=339340 RepID=UPI0026364E9B|nr:FecR family protein [uncultured Chitinophaga sp.]